MSRTHRKHPPRPPRAKSVKKQQIKEALSRQKQAKMLEFPEPDDLPTLKPMG